MSIFVLILGAIAFIILYKQSVNIYNIHSIEIKNNFIQNGIVTNKTFVTKLRLEDIKKEICYNNEKQKIYNQELFNPVEDPDLVLLIQVHNRLEYLRVLIQSLSKAKYINSTLLIFSHDVYDEYINNEIRNIKFCKVMQIFYPFSIQVHPDKFPGLDPSDCLLKISLNEYIFRYFYNKINLQNICRAIEKKCRNAFYNDSYGHYRNAKIVQIKHHWWWKLNFIFKNLRILNNYAGLVLLLEEDYYLAPDFVEVLKLMRNYSNQFCAKCGLFFLGFQHLYDYSKSNRIFITKRLGDFGLALNRSIWYDISQYYSIFCTYDDYNWDWTLRYIINKIMSSTLSMVMTASRVYHTGKCGIHHNNKKCEPSRDVEKFKKKLTAGILFPKSLKLIQKKIENKILRNGGWSDPRDHALCMGMS